MSPTLQIKNLYVEADHKPILNGVTLTIRSGEVHALMGPNGSGKSTLANVVMGHPKYKVRKGDIQYNGKSLLRLRPHERALAGLFLAFQYPKEISGVTLEEFLLAAYRAKQKALNPDKPPILVFRFKRMLQEIMQKLKIEEKFSERYLNVGFSGGEKKKAEILQMGVLRPLTAILDETDSGLDVDALRIVCDGVKNIQKESEGKMGVLLVTHYQRILKHLEPDFVHVMKKGKIVRSGDKKLAHELEEKGYEHL